tara:strand:- start:31479 stop:31967 length:489 start_codon:yes stop_codon:yes gene_type:complete
MKAWILLVLAVGLTACSGDTGKPGGGALSELRGKWLVVNYWAQWCAPCIEEIPELNALAAGRPDIHVLGVNYDGASGEELARQERELGVKFRTLTTDPAAELGIQRPSVLPTTLLIDPDGSIAATLVGPQTLESLQHSIDQAADSDAGVAGNRPKKTGQEAG